MTELSVTLKEPNINVTITDHFGAEVLTRIQVDGFVKNYIIFPENHDQMTYEQLFKIAHETMEETKGLQNESNNNSKAEQGQV